MADRVIEIIIDTNDRTGGKLEGLKKSLLEIDSAAQRTRNKLAAIGRSTYSASIRLIDRVTTPGSRINSLLKSIANKVYTVTMRLNDSILGKIRSVESSLMRLAGKAYTVAINIKDNVTGKLKGLTDGLLMGAGAMGVGMLGTAGIGYGAVNAAQAYMGFEKQMSRVQAVRQLDKNSPEMQALTQQAKDLGAQTAWTREEVGQAQYYQALAGWGTAQILKSTPHLMNLASAGDADLKSTSDIVTDTLTGFGINATETYLDKQGRYVNAVEHFTDMFAKLQASSNTDILQAGSSFRYSAPVIGAMYAGKDIQTRMQAAEDAMIMTGLMANAGIKDTMAGTGIKEIFNRMGSMNRNAYQALRALGVSYTDNKGDMLSVGTIMRNLSKRFKEGVDAKGLLDFAEAISGEKIHADTRRKLDSFIEQTQKNGGKMSSSDMLKMSSMLAGSEHMGKLLAVMLGDWDAMAEKMDNVHGTAAQMAKTQLDNLAGSLTILGSAWDAFQQSFFEGQAGDGLRNFVDSLTEIISHANNLFKDGIQLGDIGKITMDVVYRLKNKFMELDGIGSILAGGILMTGMKKLYSQALSLRNGLKDLMKTTAPSTLSAKSSPLSQVGTMNVQAGVVNVNGKVVGSKGGGVVGGNVKGAPVTLSGLQSQSNKIASQLTAAQAAANTAQLKHVQAQAASLAAWQKASSTMAAKDIAAAQLASSRATQAHVAATQARQKVSQLQTAQNQLATQQKTLATQQNVQSAKIAAQERSVLATQKYYAQKEQAAGLARADAAIAAAKAERLSAIRTNGAFAGIMTGLFGAMDFAAVKSQNQNRLSSFDEELSAIRKNYEELKAAGAPNEQLANVLTQIQEMESQRAEIIRENVQAEKESLGGAAGATLGSMAGAALGSMIGPMGTMLGGIIGAAIGDYLGTKAAGIDNGTSAAKENEGGVSEEKILSGMKKEPPHFFEMNQPDYSFDAPITRTATSDWSGMNELRRGYGHKIRTFEERMAQLDEEFLIEKGESQQRVLDNLIRRGQAGTALFQNDSAFEFYQEQAAAMEERFKAGANVRPIDDLFFNKASAAELNEEQLLQQAAMEKPRTIGEAVAEKATLDAGTPEVESFDFASMTEQFYSDVESFSESISEIFSGLGDSISESLSSSFEGVGEIFSSFTESVGENLTSAFEGMSEYFSEVGATFGENLSASLESVSEIFSAFGESVTENLTSAFEGAGEIFISFGEMITEALTSAQASAESALTAIGAAFTSAKEMIQSSWAELPSFFAGIFDGLGGIAAAAGAAIAAGLTAPIGSIIGAWQGAAAQISAIISSISAMASSATSMIPSFGGLGGAGKAEGGFVTSETHFFAGEHGAEVVIPLSTSRRARALDLFEKTAAILGGEATIPVGDYSEDLPSLNESFSGGNFSLDSETPVAPVEKNNNSAQVSLGGINVTFSISGAEKPQEILQTIQDHLEELADKIGGQLSSSIGDCFQNQALEN